MWVFIHIKQIVEEINICALEFSAKFASDIKALTDYLYVFYNLLDISRKYVAP